jgi:hypothetical protein
LTIALSGVKLSLSLSIAGVEQAYKTPTLYNRSFQVNPMA